MTNRKDEVLRSAPILFILYFDDAGLTLKTIKKNDWK